MSGYWSKSLCSKGGWVNFSANFRRTDVQIADLSNENFKSSRVMRWWLSRLSSHFGAKSSRECKPKWLPGLAGEANVSVSSRSHALTSRAHPWREQTHPTLIHHLFPLQKGCNSLYTSFLMAVNCTCSKYTVNLIKLIIAYKPLHTNYTDFKITGLRHICNKSSTQSTCN